MLPAFSVQGNSACSQDSPRAGVCNLRPAIGNHCFSNLVELSSPGSKAPLHCSPPAAPKVPDCPSERCQPAAIGPQGRAGKQQWRWAAAVHGCQLLSWALPVPVPTQDPSWVGWNSLWASALAPRGKAGARLAVTTSFSPCSTMSRDAGQLLGWAEFMFQALNLALTLNC